MKCPTCNVNLVMSDRQGVEIDYCPECRGVWLDRGELDKIIERSDSYQAKETNFDHGKNDRDKSYESNKNREYYDERSHKKHKRGGFLGEIFDFGD